jgi:predicted XRE-type DNA-binding protein
MNTRVLYYLEKFKAAAEDEIPDLLVEAMKALPAYEVGYNLEKKEAFIKLDVAKQISSRIAESGMTKTKIAELLNIRRTNFQMDLAGYKNRTLSYDQTCKLLAIFDNETNHEVCIKASDLKAFLEFYESSKVLHDNNGFFHIESGIEYNAEDVIMMFKNNNN